MLVKLGIGIDMMAVVLVSEGDMGVVSWWRFSIEQSLMRSLMPWPRTVSHGYTKYGIR